MGFEQCRMVMNLEGGFVVCSDQLGVVVGPLLIVDTPQTENVGLDRILARGGCLGSSATEFVKGYRHGRSCTEGGMKSDGEEDWMDKDILMELVGCHCNKP
jgi:hypothetical protein